MSDFEYMNDAVDALCKSLIEEPEKWVFSTHTFQKNGSAVRYWDQSYDSPVCKIWNGKTTDEVFSHAQGQRVRAAYNIARTKQSSKAQSDVIKEFQKHPPTGTRALLGKFWWEFWK